MKGDGGMGWDGGVGWGDGIHAVENIESDTKGRKG